MRVLKPYKITTILNKIELNEMYSKLLFQLIKKNEHKNSWMIYNFQYAEEKNARLN